MPNNGMQRHLKEKCKGELLVEISGAAPASGAEYAETRSRCV
jgi:hypothetical protein